DFLHKQSRQITNAYDCVCIEELDMKAISKCLNFGKSVSDNGWGMFVTFLQYKLEESGKKLVKVDKFFASSQICNVCGYKNTATKNLSIRAWDCPECGRNKYQKRGYAYHKRIAIYIKTVGHTGLARLCLVQ
uniref:zinc ribbon domain-containing protein n=1 Tax=uncultured Dubosiella sp. TaxID=1937011 RepID=UPI0025B2C6A3